MKQTPARFVSFLLLIGCGLAGWLAGAGQETLARASAPGTPRTGLHPPRVPTAGPLAPPISAARPSRPLALPPLKAVLLVGPIDGDDGEWTTEEKANMDLAAAELEANGVTVVKFYTPTNDWEQIKAAANGAQFLFYRGHGVYWGEMPNPPVGGFALKDKFVSNDGIRNDLHLAPNAIIMIYGCFSAGSAGNDTASIDSAEAQRRVAMYSHPFLDIGAAGYYADWFGDAFQMYVRYLFQGMTLRQAYESFYDFNGSTVERYTHPDHPEAALWLDKDNWYDPMPQYNDAFVGQPDRTLNDLFGAPGITDTPTVTPTGTPTETPTVAPTDTPTATPIVLDGSPTPTATPPINVPAFKVFLPGVARFDPLPTPTPTSTVTPTPTLEPTFTPSPTATPPVGWSDFEIQVVQLTNQERANNGCSVMLAMNDLLHQAATNHSLDMISRDFFSHTNPDGKLPWDRLDDLGYDWSRVGENIAAGYPSPEAVVAAWMNSAGHRANMLNCNFTEIGVGYAYDGNDSGSVVYYHYWTQVFATPR